MKLGGKACPYPFFTPEFHAHLKCLRTTIGTGEGCYEKLRAARASMQANGNAVIGQGFHRTVFANNKCVLKVANTLWGVLANANEARNWTTMDEEGDPDLASYAPVLGLMEDGYVLVMERADTSKADRALALLEAKGFRGNELNDGNTGFIGRRPVIIDYDR